MAAPIPGLETSGPRSRDCPSSGIWLNTVWNEAGDNWDDLYETLMEDFAENLTIPSENRDREDLILDSE